MSRNVLVILIEKRRATADKVQKVLTAFGCIIKTRLGLHDAVGNVCSDTGLIILELVGEYSEQRSLASKLTAIKGVSIKLVKLAL